VFGGIRLNEHEKITSRSRLLTIIFAFLLPGAGHWYAGSYSKGLLLFAGFLLDLFALIRLAEWNGGKHLLLIVYLGLLLPIFYYISVFDALQSLDKKQSPRYALLTQGSALIVIGCILVLLVNPGQMIREQLEFIAPWLTGLLPILFAVMLLLPLENSYRGSFRLGRYTASFALAAIGVIWVLDDQLGKSYMELIPSLWPYLFIAFGVELVAFSALNRRKLKLRLSISGLMFALVMASATYLVTQNSDLPERFLEQFQIAPKIASELGEDKGFHFNKPIINADFNHNLANIKINNVNGNVVVESADIPHIQVSAEVWIDLDEEQKAQAQAAADETQIVINEGETTLSIVTESNPYGSDQRIPRVDMHIVVPLQLSNNWVDTVTEPGTDSDLELDISSPVNVEVDGAAPTTPSLDDVSAFSPEAGNAEPADEGIADELQRHPAIQLKIDVQNGSVRLTDLRLDNGLNIKIDTGDVEAYRISAPIQMKINNGKIRTEQVIGESTLETKNGVIEGIDLLGQVYAKATNGSVTLSRVEYAIEAETKNGNIDISYAAGAIKADTLNGNITVMSPIIKGDWDLDSSVGEMSVTIPPEGDYMLRGSVTFGTITSELPFEIVRKTIKGRSGDGKYRIQINATNSIYIKALP